MTADVVGADGDLDALLSAVCEPEGSAAVEPQPQEASDRLPRSETVLARGSEACAQREEPEDLSWLDEVDNRDAIESPETPKRASGVNATQPGSTSVSPETPNTTSTTSPESPETPNYPPGVDVLSEASSSTAVAEALAETSAIWTDHRWTRAATEAGHGTQPQRVEAIHQRLVESKRANRRSQRPAMRFPSRALGEAEGKWARLILSHLVSLGHRMVRDAYDADDDYARLRPYRPEDRGHAYGQGVPEQMAALAEVFEQYISSKDHGLASEADPNAPHGVDTVERIARAAVVYVFRDFDPVQAFEPVMNGRAGARKAARLGTVGGRPKIFFDSAAWARVHADPALRTAQQRAAALGISRSLYFEWKAEQA
jgi:hypothetical protein